MENGYTTPALLHASGSQNKILLTDIHNLRNDLANYTLQESNTENMLSIILEKLENIEKDQKQEVNKVQVFLRYMKMCKLRMLFTSMSFQIVSFFE